MINWNFILQVKGQLHNMKNKEYLIVIYEQYMQYRITNVVFDYSVKERKLRKGKIFIFLVNQKYILQRRN
jgi:hypothetical protein